MLNVAEVNRHQRADWCPSPELVVRALTNKAYPPQGRAGVGPVVRRTR